MDDFAITSPQGALCTFHSPERTAVGWLESYVVTLEADGFHATACIANPGFGTPPSELFMRLAAHSTGWPGREAWRSAEGDLHIEATCDRTGHVTLQFTLPPSQSSPYRSATASVRVDLGEVARLAGDASEFFA